MQFEELKDVYICSCVDVKCKKIYTLPNDTKSNGQSIILPCGHRMGYGIDSKYGLIEKETDTQKIIKALREVENEICFVKSLLDKDD